MPNSSCDSGELHGVEPVNHVGLALAPRCARQARIRNIGIAIHTLQHMASRPFFYIARACTLQVAQHSFRQMPICATSCSGAKLPP